MINRRTFLCGLTLGTLSAPLAAEAQQTTQLQHVGVLTPAVSSAVRDVLQAFRAPRARLAGRPEPRHRVLVGGREL